MDKLVPALIVVAFLALVFGLMALGWRTRRRRQADVVGLEPVPSEDVPSGDPAALLTEDLLYVATTRADSPLDRIAVAGLGFRSRAVLAVTASGLELHLAGQTPGFIAAGALEGVGRATWTIDRVVGNDGLVFVRWSARRSDAADSHARNSFDSYFRSADPAALVAAISELIPTTAGADA